MAYISKVYLYPIRISLKTPGSIISRKAYFILVRFSRVPKRRFVPNTRVRLYVPKRNDHTGRQIKSSVLFRSPSGGDPASES